MQKYSDDSYRLCVQLALHHIDWGRFRIRGFLRPLHQKQIVQNALSMIGNEEYNIVQNNCEHFAVLCRYGRKWSDQSLL
ncbi:hypothetical protein KUTeg_022048 [Tegillarca granosa]|uniref:LRAT domain-containing protein n=1 Tax=Tegillarca granosa TaxID=220873 RepID=A0ABQ9E542_TEGGR|nr:hypothetical protein KUTeg_022048 [Tegillarca granosa]